MFSNSWGSVPQTEWYPWAEPTKGGIRLPYFPQPSPQPQPPPVKGEPGLPYFPQPQPQPGSGVQPQPGLQPPVKGQPGLPYDPVDPILQLMAEARAAQERQMQLWNFPRV